MEKRLRNYGESTSRRFEIAQDALTDKIAVTRSDSGRRFSKMMSDNFAGWASQDCEDSVLIEQTRRETALYSDVAPELLPKCEPIYVTSGICNLLEASRHTLPKFELRESDLLVPNGFVWLEEPIKDFWEEDVSANLPSIALEGFAWMTSPQSKNAFVLMYPAKTRIPGYPSAIVFPGEGEIADFDFPIARLLVAFWLLARQELAVSDTCEVSRPVRRRAKAQEIKTVVVVDLRRRTHSKTNGSSKVEWSHQWLVPAHWHNYWYPSEGRIKPKWVGDYLKGPEDKPFVAKRRVFDFHR